MRRFLALLVILAIAAAVAGCFNPFAPRVSTERVTSTPAPTPSSPANAVRLFAWCWEHRDLARYTEVFTDDYRFVFSPTDSFGLPYRDRPYIREDEMVSALHLFTGGSDHPPASDISIAIDNQLVTAADGRPGHLNIWHRTVHTHVDLKVTVTDASGVPSVTPVVGYMLMYMVRGDSAAIPSELVAKGFKPDSTRWWIERWEDETVGNSAQAAVHRGGSSLAGARPASVTLDLPPQPLGWLKTTWLKSY